MTNIPIEELLFLQYTYEMMEFDSMCTSFVVFDSSCNITIHGRNLDYVGKKYFQDITVIINYF